jgi:exopolyphosphatase / guanosine-5'-triphosphate,3'-diphosphate pyrophosphatase
MQSKSSKTAGKDSNGPIMACIDLGTNSFHMIVCQAIPERDHFEIMIRFKEAVPFFRRALSAHYIDDTAMRSAIGIVKDMVKKANAKGAQSVIAVATSAVRESKNGSEFLQRLRQDLEIDAKMISGKEEGRLIYLGVLWSMPELAGRFTIVDIGGGSCEVIVADRSKSYFSESYKLGAARLTQRFFRKGQPTPESIRELHEEVAGVLKPAGAKVADSGGFERLIGTSGTVQALARIDREKSGQPHSEVHGWSISLSRLETIVASIEAAGLAGQRIKQVSQDRSQTILAGSIVLLETLRALKANEVTFCSAALREGVVVDQLLQTGWLDCGLDEHRDPRSDSVLGLLKTYDGSFEHSSQVARLAMEIFNQTKDVLHNMSKEEGHLLWSAAMLHDVGMFIGRNGHHKHSYYLVRHAGLLGYSEEEVEIIANIARYHRGSEPKDSHEPYVALPADSRKLVTNLSAILRLGEALDRSHRQVITGLKAKLIGREGQGEKRQLLLELIVPLGEDVSAEKWALNEKKQLFETLFKLDLAVDLRAGFAYAVHT